MPTVKDKGWTLHYTIGDALAAPVHVGDIIELPRGGSVTVLGGRAPSASNKTGGIQVSDAVTVGGLEARPSALGTRWVSAIGGLGEV